MLEFFPNNSMSSTHHLRDLFENVFCWYAQGDDFLAELVEVSGDTPQHITHIIKREDMANFNYRLPVALDAMFAHIDSLVENNPQLQIKRNILGMKVRQLCDLWEHPERMTFTECHPKLHLSGISSILPSSNQPQVEVEGFGYVINYVKHAQEEIAYFTARFKETFYVSRDWLRSQFPHWEERYDIAVMMGYKGHELAEMVCVREHETKTIPMLELTFA